ncbi:MAG: HAD family hydrolase [Thermodesulfobacteriota bacterium]
MDASVDTIVFDFDGTLVDSTRAVKQAFEETLAEMEERPPGRSGEKNLETLSCRTLAEMFHAAGVTRPDRIDRAIGTYNRRYLALSPIRSTLFPEVPQVLQHLRDREITLAVATNERRENLDALLPAFGLDGFFEATICENEVSRSKPEPEMLHTLLKTIDADPLKTLMVGDSNLDMEMGRRAGCRTCAAGYGTHSAEQLNAAGPDHIIKNPEDLMDVVAGYFFIRT